MDETVLGVLVPKFLQNWRCINVIQCNSLTGILRTQTEIQCFSSRFSCSEFVTILQIVSRWVKAEVR
jgi:hypothetical protein